VQGTTEIPRAGWNDFFTNFTRAHETELVSVEIMGAELGAQVEGRSLLLGGISPGDEKGDSVALMFDSLNGDHLTHTVSHAAHVWLQRGDTEEALEIRAADGTTTLLRFAAHTERRRTQERAI